MNVIGYGLSYTNRKKYEGGNKDRVISLVYCRYNGLNKENNDAKNSVVKCCQMETSVLIGVSVESRELRRLVKRG